MVDTFDPAENYVHRGLRLFAGYGDAEALVAVDGRRFSYTQLRQRILDTAAWLWEHGIRPGMAIGFLVTNPAESFFAAMGAHLLGCRTAFMAHSTPRAFLRDVLSLVEADAFIYEEFSDDEDNLKQLGRELAAQAGSLKIFCIGAGGLGPDLTDPPQLGTLPFDLADVTTEPVGLFQTGGTTGPPKLVRHGQRFFHSIARVAEFYSADIPKIRHLLIASTWHVATQSTAILTWFSGGTLYMHYGIEMERYLATIAAERITSCMVSPPMLYQLLDDPRFAQGDISSFRYFTVSASAASPTRLRTAVDRFGPRSLTVAYGMSEMPFIAAMANVGHDPAHPGRLGSCGRPWGDAQVEIRDPRGTVLPAGEAGEVWVRSDLVMEGYWKQPELTAETLVDGWLRTGDVGRFDEDGYLYIVDRVRDMILTDLGSTNVFCRPLEDALAEHPEVRQAVVVGVPDDFLGEAVHAYVVRTPGATVTEEELRQMVEDKLNHQWSPREVEFVDAIPLTEFGKVDKKQLRARYVARTGGAH